MARHATKTGGRAPVAPARATVGLEHSGMELGPKLPPPEAWPPLLKRLVAGTLLRDGRTWADWCRAWKPGPDGEHGPEPMWCALRTVAWRLTGSLKLISNDDAWSICVRAVRRLAQQRIINSGGVAA